VIISGSGLTDATAVMFGTTAAASYHVDSANQITATSPAGSAGIVDVTVTTSGGTSALSASDKFTYAEQPPNPVPEFPSGSIPAILVIGFIGIVMIFVRRNGEH
jgi:hypothetical protein